MSIILLNIDPIVVKDDSQDGDSDDENGDSQEGNGSGGGNTISDEELQDMIDSDSIGSSTTPDENLSNDDGSDSVELSQRQKDMLRKHFEKQEKFLDGDVQKTKLNKKESKILKLLKIQVLLMRMLVQTFLNIIGMVLQLVKVLSVWLLEN